MEDLMSVSIRINDDLYDQAKTAAKGECRTIAGQLEFWARVGRAALDNPDLPVDFVRELLIARSEEKDQLTTFSPSKLRG
jgi:hypothetical protein